MTQQLKDLGGWILHWSVLDNNSVDAIFTGRVVHGDVAGVNASGRKTRGYTE